MATSSITSLFKKDSKGKLRIWKTYTVGSNIVEEYGLIDGKHAQNVSAAVPKNVGRANQTTAEEQAISEMNSKIASKLDEGYFRTLEEATGSSVILPMLAKEFDKESSKIDWTVAFAQPKLDGMRALAFITKDGVKLMSRAGKIIITVPHILQALLDRFQGMECILDGELYLHGATFQENMSLVKKYVSGETEKISYHIYDQVSTEPFSDRSQCIQMWFDGFAPTRTLALVPTFPVTCEKDIAEIHAENIQLGFEGTMVRWGKAGYESDGRSKHLLKRKDFKDVKCQIIDVIPGEADPTQGILVCTHNEQQFKSSMKGTKVFRAQVLANKHEYIGQQAEIRYFEETDGGLPRFPVCVGFRED